MDAELKEQWALALESGEYSQGTEALATADKFDDGNVRYCCLGVLCELVKDQYRVEVSLPDTDGYISYDDEPNLLPCTVWRALDFTDESPEVNIPDADWENVLATMPENNRQDASETRAGHNCGFPGVITLAELNDKGVPFGEIARIIRKYL